MAFSIGDVPCKKLLLLLVFGVQNHELFHVYLLYNIKETLKTVVQVLYQMFTAKLILPFFFFQAGNSVFKIGNHKFLFYLSKSQKLLEINEGRE